MIFITHADVDHFGGLEVLRAACPRAMIIAPAQDRRWIEHTDAIFAERYDAYHADHSLTYEPEITQGLHEWHGLPVPTDIGLPGGETIRLSKELSLQILHVPGHTPGHLMLWEPVHRVAIIGDALNGFSQLDRDGAWTAPPPYTDRELYLTSIQTIQMLAPRILLTGHYPVMRDEAISAFVNASRDFVMRVDAMLARLLLGADKSVTLKELIELANPLLGPFNFPPDLAFALEAHLSWLEQIHKVKRLQQNGIVAWTRNEPDIF